MSEGEWRRPEASEGQETSFPREYSRFKGKRPMPDGRVPTFCIRDVAPEQDEAVVEYMATEFLSSEQWSLAAGVPEDPLAVEDAKAMWRRLLQQRVSLVALTDWSEDGEDGEERIVGCNVLAVVRRGDPRPKLESECARRVFDVMFAMLEEADVFTHFGRDAYLGGVGLSVSAPFRGQDIGLRLLQAREALCATIGVPLTVTVFSGPASQRQAAKAGLQLLKEYRHADLPQLPRTPWPVSQLRARLFDFGSA